MSQAEGDRARIVNFGIFEVDLCSRELRKAGVRIALQEQPFRVLTRLLEHPGALVTREELQRELWTGETFVDFDHGLNVAIKRLRDALGDDAETPRFIETLPRRGYRFVAPVGAAGARGNERDDRPTSHAAARRSLLVYAAATATIALSGIAAMWLTRGPRTPKLTDRDTILVADFVNKTGDAVFDGTLREGLSVQLEQSPFLSVVPRERVRAVLKEMTRTPDELVVGDVAREVCQRAGAKVSVIGRITPMGARYVVGLQAIVCESGETVASEQTEAADREHVLAALGGAVSPLRMRLGESAGTVQRFNQPLREATTGSLEALKVFSIAEDTREKEGDSAAKPFYERAIALDPDFAMAHARLSAVHANWGRRQDMLAETRRAYELRDRATEHERLYIQYRACTLPGADTNCFRDVPELWRRIYPRDAGAYQALNYAFNNLGEYEKGVENGVEALRLNPDNYLVYAALDTAYEGLNRFEEAKRLLDNALARGIHGLHHHVLVLAFVRGDRDGMEREAAIIRAQQPDLLVILAQVAACEGRLTDARRLSPGDYDRIGVTAAAVGTYRRDVASRSPVLSSLGDLREATIAALLARDLSRAQALLRANPLGRQPAATWPRGQVLQTAQILLRVENGDRTAIGELPAQAAGDLNAAIGFERVYLRGLAYLHGDDAPHAVAEFQRIINRRGVDGASVLYPLAFVQQARAYFRIGDLPEARKDYERFFQFWKNADPDVPILRQAKAEYARIR